MLEKLKTLNGHLDHLLDQLDQLKKENDQLREQLRLTKEQLTQNSNGSTTLVEPGEAQALKEKIDKNIADIDQAIEILSNR